MSRLILSATPCYPYPARKLRQTYRSGTFPATSQQRGIIAEGAQTVLALKDFRLVHPHYSSMKPLHPCLLQRLNFFTKRVFSTNSARTSKKTLRSIRRAYERHEPLAMLTAYDYPTALHADLAGVDMVLVGDSLGMVVLGERTTQSVTVDQMVHHTRAARRGTSNAMLIADMPFGSYETCTQRAVDTAMRLVKEGGADAVKLEGGEKRMGIIRAVVDAGVAVMGHVGLMPQMVSKLGGFRAIGRSTEEAVDVLKDAKAVEDSGAFSVVVECVPGRLAEVVTRAIDIPTIGIGSGVGCDGQVLVYHDMLGILSHPHHAKVAPKFSKMFVDIGGQIHGAIGEYCRQVKEKEFPSEQYSPYAINDEAFEEFCKEANKIADVQIEQDLTVQGARTRTRFDCKTNDPSGETSVY